MMDEIEKLLKEYEKKFDDMFPTIPFSGRTDAEIAKIINDCLSKNKDVYELGYLTLDPNVFY
jgi:hypothetical protein